MEKRRMSELNINTFNEILLNGAKDDESKIKILEAELTVVADIFFLEVAILLDELEEKNYKSYQFQKIINIRNNSEELLNMVEKLKGGEG